ncbi:IS66 family transposase [Chamaesiphon minutus]|uniref:Transposase IS66 family n=1 Tax=Chamaesiphon minutus (strain ATCC 27169 / PCC 6605) TaxID=1173020 RepID=K9UKX5_CHAP6|nr:IS66 family transposase [Chamaesiphon minutus]AFY94829.1 Transposase IS66 family [Chamaesiphon minutus PCC 6605]
MEQMPQLDQIELSTADWEGTPIAVQQLVLALLAENQELKARLSVIEEQIKQNSQNSSKPPSKDGFGTKPKVKKAKGQRNRGGQLGHPGHERNFHELTAESEIHEHIPSSCRVCGVELEGADPQPYRHQVIEVPPITAKITEHRLHQLACQHCGEKTRAKLPAGISAVGYGARLSALVAWLSSDYRQSHGQLQQLLKQLLGIEISIASINRLRQEMSLALESVVTQAHEYVQSQPQIHSDETSFSQGNCDGHNPKQRQGWLWVVVTKLMSIFEVSLNRGQVTAKQMIGERYTGIVISDRYSSYNWLSVEQRQVCWAHLKRDLTAMSERSGVSQTIGQALLKRQQRLFRWWHRVRDGTMTRADFELAVVALRQGFKAELESAVELPIGKNENTPLAKTVRTCEQLLKIEPALWTFVTVPGIEPTNNAAEQALRQAVIWRRTSFGSQSLAGSQFVARLLSVVTSLKAQQRDVWDFLTLVCQAARFDLPMPSLIPLDCPLP